MKKWIKTGSFGEHNPDSVLSFRKHGAGASKKAVLAGGEIETEADGQEPCFSCGDKVVWRMKEGWGLVCKGCGKAQ